MTRMRGPVLELCICFVRPPSVNATSDCLQAQLGLQHHFRPLCFDQKTPRRVCLLAPKVVSTPQVGTALLNTSSSRQAGPGRLVAQPGLLQVLHPTDYVAARPKEGALFSVFSLGVSKIQELPCG